MLGLDVSIIKKGSRKITIEGDIYLWHLRDNNVDISVVVQLMNEGQLLKRVYGLEEVFDNPITPSRVEKLIKLGLSKGWKPSSKKSKPFLIKRIHEET